MSEATDAAKDPITQWVTFFLDNEKYGIQVMQVQEVLRLTDTVHLGLEAAELLFQESQALTHDRQLFL